MRLLVNARRIALLSVLLISGGALCQMEQVSTVTEAGDVRNVIAFSSSVSLSERFVANERVSSYRKTLKGKNVSSNPILLLIVNLDCCSTRHVYRWDNFLGEALSKTKI